MSNENKQLFKDEVVALLAAGAVVEHYDGVPTADVKDFDNNSLGVCDWNALKGLGKKSGHSRERIYVGQGDMMTVLRKVAR